MSEPGDVKSALPDWASGYASLKGALDAPPTRAEMIELMSPIVDALKEALNRVKELESSGTKFCGVYQRAMPYKRGNLTTHDGGLWAAVRDVGEDERPGHSNGWQLAVKSGRAAP